MTAQTEWSADQWARVLDVMNKSKYKYRPDFQKWLHDNYHIWLAFIDKCRELARFEDRPRFSAMAIIQVIRWNTMLSEKGKTFKVNNNFTPDLARLVMARFPVFDGFFEIRGSINRNDAPQ